MTYWVISLAVGAAVAVLLLAWKPLRSASREARFAQQRRAFHAQRERLEVKFIRLAAAAARPDGSHWEDCEFDDEVTYVRDRHTGGLAAFVAVTLPVDTPGDPSAGAGELTGKLRAGTAVFRFDRDHWETDGRAIPNLSPSEAIRQYQKDLEIVDLEPAERS